MGVSLNRIESQLIIINIVSGVFAYILHEYQFSGRTVHLSIYCANASETYSEKHERTS